MIMIVCSDKNWALGYNNELIYHIKEDMKRFRTLTWDKTVIMGRKTFQSIGKPLPSRNNIVITNDYINMNKLYKDFEDDLNTQILFMSMDKLIKNIKKMPRVYNKNAYLIGGASLYNSLIKYIDKIELTYVHPKDGRENRYIEEPKADTFLKGFEFQSKEGDEIKYELGAPIINSVSSIIYHNFDNDRAYCKVFKVINIESRHEENNDYDFVTLNGISWSEAPFTIMK